MIHHRFFFCVAGLLCLLPLASCNWISGPGPIKGTINGESGSYTLVKVTSQAQIPAVSRAYGVGQLPPDIKGQGYSDKVRSRDVLNFIVTDLTEESPFHTKGEPYKFGPVEVPEDGTIAIPYVDSIQVLNRSLSQVSVNLEEKMKPVSSTARVTVIRSDRMPRTANVIGEVRKPGPVPLERAGITSADLLSASGGPTNAEHLYKYTLRRGGMDYTFDYLGYRKKSFIVEEGDLLSVTADTDNRFHVMGAILKSATVPFPVPSPTLADALGAATGMDERRSDASGVFVFRKGSPDMVYTFDLKDPKTMHLVQRFPILGNDIVYVTEAPLARWNRLISQLLPTPISQAGNAFARYQN